MIEWKRILPFDNRLRELVNSPCWLAFLFLGFGSDTAWKFFGLGFLGIVISSLIWWSLYKPMILDGSERNRAKFYKAIIPIQLAIGTGIVTSAVMLNAP